MKGKRLQEYPRRDSEKELWEERVKEKVRFKGGNRAFLLRKRACKSCLERQTGGEKNPRQRECFKMAEE